MELPDDYNLVLLGGMALRGSLIKGKQYIYMEQICQDITGVYIHILLIISLLKTF